MAASFKELNPSLAREPRLVKYDPDDGKVSALDSFSRYLFRVLSYVPFHSLRKKLKHWDEADVFVRRKLGAAHYAKVTVRHAVCRTSFGPRSLPEETSTFYVVDPSEVSVLDDKHVAWSRGKPEPISGCPRATVVVVEAHRVIGVLCALQRVERFAAIDGDHAIGTRVVRFLVDPEFLLRDAESVDGDAESDDTMGRATAMAREMVAEDASDDEMEMGSDEEAAYWSDALDE